MPLIWSEASNCSLLPLKGFILHFTQGFIEILSYSLIFAPILIAITFILMILWGPYISIFSTLSKAFTFMPLLISGELHLDEMLLHHYGWAIFYISMLMIIIIFFVFPVFYGITIDNFRIIFKNYGNSFNKTSNWTKLDYILWFLAWLPPNILRSIAFNQQKKESRKEK